MQLKAIIIDDEASAREALSNLIKNYHSDVAIIAEANSVKTALVILKENKPDMVFLDVRLYPGTSFDILENLTHINFEIIFTTAFDSYALKAFKFSALDYLIKPISPGELNLAIEKVKKRVSLQNPESISVRDFNSLKENMSGTFRTITLPGAHGLEVIELKNIIRCEADSNYTIFHIVNQQKIMTSKTLKEYHEMLSESSFFRIQKSHLVNLYHIKKYIHGRGGQVEMTDASILNVSREQKKELLLKLKSLK